MSTSDAGLPGDQARASVLVRVAPAEAFRVFTEEIDLWWRRGLPYRMATDGTLRLEPRKGGRLFESLDAPSGPRVVETGRVTDWQPPTRLLLEWRANNFAPSEKTEVEVRFDETKSGTLVTVTHRGWRAIRPDHPVRHGDPTAAFLRTMGLWWGDLLSALRQHAAAQLAAAHATSEQRAAPAARNPKTT